MKKILSHLTGIVFLITILLTGGCGSKTNEDDSGVASIDTTKVTIYAKIYEVGDKKLLKLYDSNYPDSIDFDSLHVAYVWQGTQVVWRRAKNSGIKRFKKVGPVDKGEILTKDAKTFILHKRYRADVEETKIKRGTEQKYVIEYKRKDGKTITRDPYLKIPPPEK